MDETTQQPTVYQLDEKRRIVAIDGPWDSFALDNDGAAACAERVIGQPLLRFVCGDEARMWIDTLLQLASLTGEPLERLYRCDSPELRRFMSMRVMAEDAGMIRVEHRLLAVQRRVRPVRLPAGHGIASCATVTLFGLRPHQPPGQLAGGRPVW